MRHVYRGTKRNVNATNISMVNNVNMNINVLESQVLTILYALEMEHVLLMMFVYVIAVSLVMQEKIVQSQFVVIKMLQIQMYVVVMELVLLLKCVNVRVSCLMELTRSHIMEITVSIKCVIQTPHIGLILSVLVNLIHHGD